MTNKQDDAWKPFKREKNGVKKRAYVNICPFTYAHFNAYNVALCVMLYVCVIVYRS